MHKAVQEVEERHVDQIVLMEKINIEKGVPPVEIRKVDRRI
jgi:hypothetical protein